MAEIAKLLKNQPTLQLHVVGHTDNVAGLDLNLKLSKARAEAVASNDAEDGRAKNRRV